jgi:predicted nucleotidyltransferase
MLNLLDQVLGTESKVQVLRAVLPLNTPASGREVQRLGGIRSNAGAQRALDELSSLSILERTETAGAHLYQVNTAHHLYHALVELFDAEAGLLGVVRAGLEQALEHAGKLPAVLSVVVFGSVARGRVAFGSDLDLLVVTRSKRTVGAVEKAIRTIAAPISGRLIGLPISPYVLPMSEVASRYRKGDPLLAIIVSEGRTLLGDDLSEVLAQW